jgi:hypothetical protein
MGTPAGFTPVDNTESSPFAIFGTPWVFTFVWDRPATEAETSTYDLFDARVGFTFTEGDSFFRFVVVWEIVSSTIYTYVDYLVPLCVYLVCSSHCQFGVYIEKIDK